MTTTMLSHLALWSNKPPWAGSMACKCKPIKTTNKKKSLFLFKKSLNNQRTFRQPASQLATPKCDWVLKSNTQLTANMITPKKQKKKY